LHDDKILISIKVVKMKMKVLLIQPPSETQNLKVPPLGLAYLAAMLKKKKVTVKILDMTVENTTLESYLIQERPDIIGVSAIVTNARNALSVANKTKQILPKSFVVMGGPYPSLMRTRLLIKHSEVDAVIFGEAEITFPELVKQIQYQKKLDIIKGLVFRKDCKIIENLPAQPIRSLDQIPHPALDKLKMNLYGEYAGVIFTSRGCPQQCMFCSRPVFGKTWRGNSSEYVLEEIEHLVKNYNISKLSVIDDNFTYDLDRAEMILDGIISKGWKLKIYFWNGIRADHVTKNLLNKMKKAGCRAINYGVESVDPKVISFIRKGVTLEQIKRAIHLTQQVGILTNIFLMIGNPKDNAKSADKLIDFIKKTHVNGVHLSMATPIFGTPFWDWVEKNGNWLDYDTEELLDWPVDDIAGSYPVFETVDFTAKERIKAYMKIRNYLKENALLI